jgi:chromosomal replication initiator protein
MTSALERRMMQHYAATRGRLRGHAREPERPCAPALPDLRPADGLPAITCKDVIAHVCAFYDVTWTDLVSPRRTPNIVRPRHVAMHLARRLTVGSLPVIGAVMGKRDHTTVLYGAKRIEEAMGRDRALVWEVAELTRRISAREEPRPRPGEVHIT